MVDDDRVVSLSVSSSAEDNPPRPLFLIHKLRYPHRRLHVTVFDENGAPRIPASL